MNALQLSGYYMSENNFFVAEHCLLAAEKVLSQAAEKEQIHDANVAVAWMKFFLGRARRSRELLCMEDDLRRQEEEKGEHASCTAGRTP